MRLDALRVQVDDPVAWHRANLERNASHYSWLASLAGPARLVAVSHAIGAGVHFNPFVRLGSQVRRRPTLLSDAASWVNP